MNSIYWMFLLYFALPVASGAAAHQSAATGVFFKAVARISAASTMEKIAASIIATIVFLAILTGHIASGGPKPTSLFIMTTLPA
ncbi:hypothetical protein DM872_12655 [Pseudomonas taiwanensis]|uniref:hypothetical protein n=1 Tax=Pseudomonas taiwanensis TaxID=470150 RepID=UPI0015BAE051|nr:hypothetical protein [Pseudomonas taiwanensis]NWL77704.1 hypothetical protein [Pseudomonas taiwanensis]